MAVPLLKINDVVDQYCLASGDHDRKNYLAYQVFAKWIIRDLHLNLMPNPKRVFLRVNKKNNTVQIPTDYYRFGSISIVDDCNQIIPLSFNEYINTVKDTLDADCLKQNKCCDCKGQSEICDEVSAFETIQEKVQIPTNVGSPICDYEISLPPNPFNFALDFYILNGNSVPVATVFHNQGELDTFFSGINWTKISNTKYSITQSADTWGCFAFEGQGYGRGLNICPDDTNCEFATENIEYTNTTNIKTCENGDIIKESCIWTKVISPFTVSDYIVIFPDLSYPYVINSYRKNNTDYTVTQTIENFSQLVSYLSTLGFLYISGFEFENFQSPDIWQTFTVGSDTTVTVTSSNTQPDSSFVVEKICKTEILCNVPVLPCGCIIPTPQTEQIIATSCGCLLQTCCKMFCPTPTPQVANGYGSYNLDEKSNLIYVESSYIVEKIVLSYFTDGNIGGVMYIPEFCLDAVMRGIKYRESMVNRRYAQSARQDKLDYEQAQAELFDYQYPMRIDEVRRALKLFYQN